MGRFRLKHTNQRTLMNTTTLVLIPECIEFVNWYSTSLSSSKIGEIHEHWIVKVHQRVTQKEFSTFPCSYPCVRGAQLLDDTNTTYGVDAQKTPTPNSKFKMRRDEEIVDACIALGIFLLLCVLYCCVLKRRCISICCQRLVSTCTTWCVSSSARWMNRVIRVIPMKSPRLSIIWPLTVYPFLRTIWFD